jgi:hypothetical protein|tara:strand:- start:665 stop:802 length:138 start_codon:yes stop_codon:yes gene_type:complete
MFGIGGFHGPFNDDVSDMVLLFFIGARYGRSVSGRSVFGGVGINM